MQDYLTNLCEVIDRRVEALDKRIDELDRKLKIIMAFVDALNEPSIVTTLSGEKITSSLIDKRILFAFSAKLKELKERGEL